MLKTWELVALVGLLAVVAGCGGDVKVLVVTATPEPTAWVVTATPAPTADATAAPTVVSTQVVTPEPIPTLTAAPGISLTDLETALRAAGYGRYPFVDEDGVGGFYWVKGNAYSWVRTWETGQIEMLVLNDPSEHTRIGLIDEHFQALDSILPASFMEALRTESESYIARTPANVTGTAEDTHVYNDQWSTIIADYNTSAVEIEGYQVAFQLEWQQVTCPEKYDYCNFLGFPGLEFAGQSSFTFYSVSIQIDEPPLIAEDEAGPVCMVSGIEIEVGRIVYNSGGGVFRLDEDCEWAKLTEIPDMPFGEDAARPGRGITRNSLSEYLPDNGTSQCGAAKGILESAWEALRAFYRDANNSQTSEEALVAALHTAWASAYLACR
jgi:hypothetical protein